MIYENILLEEAEDMLHCDSSILLEASSGGKGGKGGGQGGNGQGQSNKPIKLGLFGKIKNGQYLPGTNKVKSMVKVGALKPYGFENVDITDTKKLKGVVASIKRRRDIEAARALVVGAIEAGAAILFANIGSATANAAADMAKDPQKYGTALQDFTVGTSNVFNVMSAVSTALVVFTEVANMVDIVKANKAVGQVRQNIMDAYDNVTTKIMNMKPGVGNQKETEAYHALLNYRDMLRECQLKMGNIGGVGADVYVASANL